MYNSLHWVWVCGHCDASGNEIVDKLARQAICQDFIGPEQMFGIK